MEEERPATKYENNETMSMKRQRKMNSSGQSEEVQIIQGTNQNSEANTSQRLKARENPFKQVRIGFSFISEWLKAAAPDFIANHTAWRSSAENSVTFSLPILQRVREHN